MLYFFGFGKRSMNLEVKVENNSVSTIPFGINYNSLCLHPIEMLFGNSGSLFFLAIVLSNPYTLRERERGTSTHKQSKIS